MKKFLKNPPFGMSMQAATRMMSQAMRPIAEVHSEKRAAEAADRRKVRAAEIAKKPVVKGSLNDSDWRRDDSKLPADQRSALAKTEQQISDLPGSYSFHEVVGAGLRQRMQHGRSDPSMSPVPSNLDKGARDLNAYSVMCQIASLSSGGELDGTPDGAQEKYENLTDIIDDAGAAYSLVIGKSYETGEPLDMSQHKRLEALRNFPDQELLSDMKMLHSKGTSKLTQHLEGHAREFCGAVDTRAQLKLETPMRVKRRSMQAVR